MSKYSCIPYNHLNKDEFIYGDNLVKTMKKICDDYYQLLAKNQVGKFKELNIMMK